MRQNNINSWLTTSALLLSLGCGSEPVDTLDPDAPPGAEGALGGQGAAGGVDADGSPAATGSAGGAAGSGAGMGGTPVGQAGATEGTAAPGGGAMAGGAMAGASQSGSSAGSGASDPGVPPGARPGLVARLGKTEYTYSILDVTGVQLTDAELDANSGGIPDDTGDGVFKHFADKQTSVEQHPSAYFMAARGVAERVDVQALSGQHGFCVEPSVDCGQAAVTSVGRHLFRRALDERETTVFTTLFTSALDEGEDFAGAFGITLQALLQAPQFLFRMEDELAGSAGTDRPLSDLELATRLAAFLWVSVPDETLLAAAESNTLSDPATLQGQVQRMLADPKAQRFTEAFIADFSRAKLASFTGATEADRDALHESVTATFQHHFWEAKRSVAELFTTTEFMLNARSAELIEAPMAGAGMQLVDVAGLPERVGLLSHPGMIAGMGDLDVGSFVNRGKVLMERLLCANPVAVPAGLLDQLEEFNADTTGLNEHERAAIRKTRPECWGCHVQFEPLAFGFSRFDGAGRYIGEVDPEGRPLPLDGWLPQGREEDSPQYSNFTEYMDILATEPVVQRCMTEHFLSFATAHGTDALAKQHADLVSDEYIAGGSTLDVMVAAVVKTTLFGSIRTFDPAAAAAGEEN